jgi:methyl-accepting chemotaxis protein
MKLSDLKIGTRLALGFGAVLVLMVGLTLSGIYGARQINAALDRILRGALAPDPGGIGLKTGCRHASRLVPPQMV